MLYWSRRTTYSNKTCSSCWHFKLHLFPESTMVICLPLSLVHLTSIDCLLPMIITSSGIKKKKQKELPTKEIHDAWGDVTTSVSVMSTETARWKDITGIRYTDVHFFVVATEPCDSIYTSSTKKTEEPCCKEHLLSTCPHWRHLNPPRSASVAALPGNAEKPAA